MMKQLLLRSFFVLFAFGSLTLYAGPTHSVHADRPKVLSEGKKLGQRLLTELNRYPVNTSEVEALLANPLLDASVVDREGSTPLHLIAVYNFDVTWLEALLHLPKENRPDINRKNDYGVHPLDLALSLFHSNSTTANVFFSQPHLQLTKADKERILQQAAARGFIDVLEKVYTGPEEPDINAQCEEEQRTALLYALIENQLPAALWLLNRHDIDASASDSEGLNAWHYIAYHGKSRNRKFRDKGRSCPCCEPLSNTVSTASYPMSMAFEIIQKIRQLPPSRQPDIRQLNRCYNSPVQIAEEYEHFDIAHVLDGWQTLEE